MIYSFELEKQLLAGLIKYPDRYADIADFITEKDFWSEIISDKDNIEETEFDKER